MNISKQLTVFIVEDDPIFSCMIQFVLHKMNVQNILTFASEKELDYYPEIPSDLLVVDHQLEEGDGLSVLEKVKKEHKQTKVIFVSSANDQNLFDMARRKGADYCFVKNDSTLEKIKTIVRDLRDNPNRGNNDWGLHSLAMTISILLSVFVLFSGCTSYNLLQTEDAVSYEEWITEESKPELLAANGIPFSEDPSQKDKSYVLQIDDKLSLSVWNHNDLSVGSVFSEYNSNEVYGKWLLINKQGEVALPQLGRVSLAGFSIVEAETKLTESLRQWIVDPIVVIKVLNREISVLGEVNSPGKILLEKERNTLQEVLAMAGGLGEFADSRKLKLVRGEKEIKINLTKLNGQELSNIEIQSDDFIYVPAQKSKGFVKKSPALIPVASALTAILLLFSTLKN